MEKITDNIYNIVLESHFDTLKYGFLHICTYTQGVFNQWYVSSRESYVRITCKHMYAWITYTIDY